MVQIKWNQIKNNLYRNMDDLVVGESVFQFANCAPEGKNRSHLVYFGYNKTLKKYIAWSLTENVLVYSNPSPISQVILVGQLISTVIEPVVGFSPPEDKDNKESRK